MNPKHVKLQHFEFPEQTEPKGFLPRDKRAQACWYFYTLAQKQKEKVGKSIDDQILLEGEMWMDTHYVQTAKTVALMYGLESPDEFMKFWDYVEKEAFRWGLPKPSPEYTRPLRRLII